MIGVLAAGLNLNVLGGVDAKSNSAPANFQDRDLDVVRNDDLLIPLPADNEHPARPCV